MNSWEVVSGDCLEVLRNLEESSVDLVCTSPPYYGLRANAGTERVWGGEPNCTHNWTDQLVPWGSRNSSPTMHKTTQGLVDNPVRKVGCSFCETCGAWRGQLGGEPHPSLYIEHLLLVMDELWRVLKPTGVVFWNHGDSYGGSGCGANDYRTTKAKQPTHIYAGQGTGRAGGQKDNWLRGKQLLLIPSRFAAGCQERGWLLRNDVAWAKPNAQPSSVIDRFSCAWEHVFFFSKEPLYFFNLDDVRVPYAPVSQARYSYAFTENESQRQCSSPAVGSGKIEQNNLGKNPTDVWRIHTANFPDAHYAVFPPDLATRMVLAGCPPKVCSSCGLPWRREVTKGEIQDSPHRVGRKNPPGQFSLKDGEYKGSSTLGKVREITLGPWEKACSCEAEAIPGLVLDPFCGSGTTGIVAKRLGRRFLGIEMIEEYVEMSRRRVGEETPPLF